MRTDYAGRSLAHAAQRIADYDGLARQAAGILAKQAGDEPGDPARVAEAILAVVDSDSPPMHLLLGADAVHYAMDKLAAFGKEIAAWMPTSLSTAAAL